MSLRNTSVYSNLHAHKTLILCILKMQHRSVFRVGSWEKWEMLLSAQDSQFTVTEEEVRQKIFALDAAKPEYYRLFWLFLLK